MNTSINFKISLTSVLVAAVLMTACGENKNEKSPFYGKNRAGVDGTATTQQTPDGGTTISLNDGTLSSKVSFGTKNADKVPVNIKGKVKIRGWEYSFNFTFSAKKDVDFQSDNDNFGSSGYKLYSFVENNFLIIDGRCNGPAENPCSTFIIKYSVLTWDATKGADVLNVFGHHKIAGKNEDLIALEDNYDVSVDELYSITVGI